MSMLFMTTIRWQPAHETLEDDDLDWEDQEDEIQQDIPFQDATCVYSPYLHPNDQPAPLFPVKDFTAEQWKAEQRLRTLAPIGERVLIRRRFHESVTFGKVIQDTMMVRVEEPHQWNSFHVFYQESEASPVPLLLKKRKY